MCPLENYLCRFWGEISSSPLMPLVSLVPGWLPVLSLNWWDRSLTFLPYSVRPWESSWNPEVFVWGSSPRSLIMFSPLSVVFSVFLSRWQCFPPDLTSELLYWIQTEQGKEKGHSINIRRVFILKNSHSTNSPSPPLRKSPAHPLFNLFR